jgi:enterobactin synthetase component F
MFHVILSTGLMAYVQWFLGHFHVTPHDIFIQKTSVMFDASVDEIWTCLAAGATLVIAPPEAHRDPFTIMHLINRWA